MAYANVLGHFFYHRMKSSFQMFYVHRCDPIVQYALPFTSNKKATSICQTYTPDFTFGESMAIELQEAGTVNFKPLGIFEFTLCLTGGHTIRCSIFLLLGYCVDNFFFFCCVVYFSPEFFLSSSGTVFIKNSMS